MTKYNRDKTPITGIITKLANNVHTKIDKTTKLPGKTTATINTTIKTIEGIIIEIMIIIAIIIMKDIMGGIMVEVSMIKGTSMTI